MSSALALYTLKLPKTAIINITNKNAAPVKSAAFKHTHITGRPANEETSLFLVQT